MRCGAAWPRRWRITCLRTAARLSPHLLRQFAASDLYRNGMNVVAIQEVLGHQWLNTTMIYVHVDNTHIEQAWAAAGRRAVDRFGGR